MKPMRRTKRRMLRSKKGSVVEETLEQVPEIMLTIVVIIGIYALVNLFINVSVDVRPLQARVLFYRLMYSPDGIAYQDSFTGKVYPGTIPLESFNNETLDKMAQYSLDRQIAAKLYIYDNRFKLVKTAYYDSELFNKLEPLVKNKVKGASSGEMYYKAELAPILYIKEGKTYSGYLDMEVMMPN